MERNEACKLTGRPAERRGNAASLVRCFWCERVHPGEHPLSVCSACKARLSTMRWLEMRGAFPLDDETIDELLVRRSPGNYALGYMDGDSFSVFYVGRCDRDLRERLHEWVGMPSRYERYAPVAKAAWGLRRGGPLPVSTPALARVEYAETSYTHFAYSYAPSPDAAFAKEWRNYDAFGGRRGLDNEVQPVPGLPSGSSGASVRRMAPPGSRAGGRPGRKVSLRSAARRSRQPSGL